MNNIVYNYDNLKEKDINRISRRAKAIIKNSKNEILLACVNNNYHLPGGHLEKNENYEECLVREIKEELGVDIPLRKRSPILTITYYNKDYPSIGINSKTIAHYYEVKSEIIPNFMNISLTEDEIKGNFKLQYVEESKIIDFLSDSLNICTKKAVVMDTIEAIKEYLNSRGNI